MILLVTSKFSSSTLLSFVTSVLFMKKSKVMKQYKRQYRQLSDETKNKISTSTRHKPKSEIHKKRIQQSMLSYWRSVKDRPEDLSMDDYLKGNNDDR